jgi:pimeloyl-ACP methyl ester carboxylesterase
VKPYTIHVEDLVLDDLKRRLANTRLPVSIPGSGWRYGADALEVQALCDYWRHSYDWRVHEARLNKVPQFVAEIDGVEIHFFHLRARSQSLMPLLLLHGWPGSSVEFEALWGPLSHPQSAHEGPAFDVVVPSMPGFGFSGKPLESGWHADRVARAFNTLMTKVLGYSRFGVQGGDWGTIVGTRMAHVAPEALRGLHINMPFGYPVEGVGGDVDRFNAVMQAETGYLHLQNTKPDALTFAQADSPAGLAAWVLEKFRTWSDCGGDVFSVFSKDTLLTNLMFYWATNSVASAARIYYESAQLDPALFRAPRITVPTGVAAFPKEPYLVPRAWLEPRFNIVLWRDMPKGGHFPALEQPALLLEDIRRFFQSIAAASR